jgi:hypothetical protein
VRYLNAEGGGGARAVVPYLRTALDLAATPTTARRVRDDLDAVEQMLAPAPVRARVSTGPTAAGTTHAMAPSTGRRGLRVVGPLGAVALIATIATDGAPLPTVILILAVLAGCGFLLPALRPTPVARSLTFLAIGAAVLATGLWWWGGPWVAVPGGLILWIAAGALHTALNERPVAQGWSSVCIGVALVIIGSLPWGGLWLGGDPGLWGPGHVGLWLVGLGHVMVVSGATGLGAGRGQAVVLTVAAMLSMGAVWLLGGGGWPAFAATIVLFLVVAAALAGAPQQVQVGLLSLGTWLIPAAVGVVAGIGSIGLVPTLLIAAAIMVFGVRVIAARSRAIARSR